MWFSFETQKYRHTVITHSLIHQLHPSHSRLLWESRQMMQPQKSWDWAVLGWVFLKTKICVFCEISYHTGQGREGKVGSKYFLTRSNLSTVSPETLERKPLLRIQADPICAHSSCLLLGWELLCWMFFRGRQQTPQVLFLSQLLISDLKAPNQPLIVEHSLLIYGSNKDLSTPQLSK